MSRLFVLFTGFLMASILLTACASREPAGQQPAGQQTAEQQPAGGVGKIIQSGQGQYTDISVNELQSMLENKDFAFVNVHIPFEGKINPTDAFIPYNEIDQHLDQLPADKDAKIVLYCRSDSMSNDAARTLVERGYTNVYNLDGGFNAWKAAGLPLDMNP